MTQLETVNTDPDTGVRFYHWSDGASLPSVTTILNADPEKKKAIENFQQTHPRPEEYKNEQGTLGSIVHHRILKELSIRRLEPPALDMGSVYDGIETDIETAEMLWDDAVDQYPALHPGDSPHVESPIRNLNHRYAGRFDLLTDGGTLIDLKVSPTVHDSYKMQAAAYWRAIERDSDLPTPNRAAIVSLYPRIDKNPHLTPTVSFIPGRDLDRWFNRFLEVKEVFDR